MNTIFFIVILLWSIVRQQVTYWVVMSALGFRTETPEYFLTKEYIYHTVSWLLFVSTIILSFFQTVLPSWIVIIIILIIDQLVKVYAQRRGCSKYRTILHEMREDRTKSSEDYSRIDKELKKTNSELLRNARERVKLGLR